MSVHVGARERVAGFDRHANVMAWGPLGVLFAADFNGNGAALRSRGG